LRPRQPGLQPNSTLDPRELGDWKRSLRMALRVARALRRIHAAGLVHGDLSYRNVILDPSGGDACLIDLDGLVVPGEYPPEVIGTPDFIAPEIVASRHLPRDHPERQLPDWHADLHALAVLIYLLLLLRHPLRGDKIHDLYAAPSARRRYLAAFTSRTCTGIGARASTRPVISRRCTSTPRCITGTSIPRCIPTSI
jgi:serine/threonine protein kinase